MVGLIIALERSGFRAYNMSTIALDYCLILMFTKIKKT
ncbi:hypothetical protein DSOL_2835 [Desulfosporosinus metallidurans]|uniref:Uncharacterized protein n=1 Tax=Desulfosporosinus metallidurans TaxID=1888891 RepID=A0A1Q8QUP8_9FIRM|nr:hypothetical protein DSOL_2835 [Desulfosporosinus metallidurans]